MASKNSRRRGPIGAIISFVVIVLLVGFVIAFARANDINSPSDAWQYLRDKSQAVRDCGAEEVEWNCKPDGSDGSGGKDGGSSNDAGDSGEASKGDEAAGDDDAKSDGDGATDADPTTALKSLTIADEEEVDYDRGEWKHWTGGKCDNTREQALKERGENVKLDGDDCRVESGKWIGPYTGKTFTNSSDMDFDHVIPLSYAARHGGQAWSLEKKEQFANDLSQLELVEASANRSKGDKGPGDWMPDNEDYTCEYSTKWVTTATKYGVSITKDDAKALEEGLATC